MHGRGIELARDGTARFGARHQSGVGQNVEMLHDRRQRDRERLRQRADRKARLLGEPRQQRAPRRVGQRSESAIERRVAILNHIVKYMSGNNSVKPLMFRSAEELSIGALEPYPDKTWAVAQDEKSNNPGEFALRRRHLAASRLCLP